MQHIIATHNRNTEEAWQEVRKWELVHARYVPATPPARVCGEKNNLHHVTIHICTENVLKARNL